MSEKREFRVSWRRKSRTVKSFDPMFGPDRKEVERQEPERTYSTIYQTRQGALRKVESLVATDRSKNEWTEDDGRNPFDFPDLSGSPTVESREVGEWEPSP